MNFKKIKAKLPPKEMVELRKQSEIKGFTFDKNDRLISFNKRKYFRNIGINKIKNAGIIKLKSMLRPQTRIC